MASRNSWKRAGGRGRTVFYTPSQGGVNTPTFVQHPRLPLLISPQIAHMVCWVLLLQCYYRSCIAKTEISGFSNDVYEESDWDCRMCGGKEFQIFGAEIRKARKINERLCRGSSTNYKVISSEGTHTMQECRTWYSPRKFRGKLPANLYK